MPSVQHLDRAPIVEALIDIRVRFPSSLTLERLQSLRERLEVDYPNVRTRSRWNASLTLHATEPATMKSSDGVPDGFILGSPDNLNVLQVRLDGFTFSRLAPYESWERLRDAARAAWTSYRADLGPLEVTRLAVRYINSLELPLPLGDFADWIRTVPQLAPELPQQLAGYFFRVNLPYPVQQGAVCVNITQKIDPQPTKGSVPMIFDIDAFDPNPDAPDDEAMWDRLEELRRVKNEVFFGSITDRLVARCQG